MSQLNSVAIESSHKVHSEHPFRKALALLLATVATSPALAAAQAAQRIQQPAPAPTTSLASKNVPPLPGVQPNASDTSTAKVLISDHPPQLNDLVLNKPYFFKLPNGQVDGCVATMVRTPAMSMVRKVLCAPASPEIQAQVAQGR